MCVPVLDSRGQSCFDKGLSFHRWFSLENIFEINNIVFFVGCFNKSTGAWSHICTNHIPKCQQSLKWPENITYQIWILHAGFLDFSWAYQMSDQALRAVCQCCSLRHFRLSFLQTGDFSPLTDEVNDQTQGQGFQSNHFQNNPHFRVPVLEQQARTNTGWMSAATFIQRLLCCEF